MRGGPPRPRARDSSIDGALDTDEDRVRRARRGHVVMNEGALSNKGLKPLSCVAIQERDCQLN